MLRLARTALLSVAAVLSTNGAELDGRWTWMNPDPPIVPWSDIAFGNGRFVATTWGRQGNHLYTSEDGISWTERAVPTESHFLGIEFVNGRFLADTLGGIVTSVDGLNWSMHHLPDYGLFAAAYGNGTYVMVGYTCHVATSPDGERWSIMRLPGENSWRALLGVAYGNGRFVAIGAGGYLITSEDAKNWKEHSWPLDLPLAEHYRVGLTFHDGYFFYGSGYSRDGVHWISGVNNGIREGTVRAAEGQLVSCTANSVAVSRTGFSWEPTFQTGIGEYLRGVAYGNGRYVAVGERGLMAHSTDGRNWEKRTARPTPPQKLVFANGHFLRYGSSNLSRSADGAEWETFPAPDAFAHMVHGNDVFAAVNESGRVYTSHRGVEWTGGIEAGASAALQFTGNQFFLFNWTKRKVLASSDARAWREAVISPTNELIRTIAFGNDRFLALGLGSVFSSRDALSWERVSRAPDYGFRVLFGNGKFLIAGQAGMGPTTLYTSEDGREWSESRGGTSYMFDGFAFVGGHFCMLDGSGQIHYSKDGLTWGFNRLTQVPLLGAAEGNGVMLVTGGSDVVLKKSLQNSLTKWLPVTVEWTNRRGVLRVSGASGAVQIEQSADFESWNAAATFNEPAGAAVLFPMGSEDPMHFYRAREIEMR